LESRQAVADDREWWTSLDEGYWQALLRQGENAPESAPPTDPIEVLSALGVGPGTEASVDTSPDCEDNELDLEKKWRLAQLALERGELFCLTAAGANRGGLLVEWNRLQGFVPASHLKVMPRHLDPDERALELAGRVGDSLTVRLIEVDPHQSQLVFSERAATEERRSPSELLHTLRSGDVCQGTVTNLTTFGAFVDLGGIEGLVHISELSWERVHHPGDVLSLGQQVQAFVLGVNPDEERIALSIKRLHPDPWTQVESRYRCGQLVEGTVTSVVSFGAFVRIEQGLEGLIHISELAEGNFLHPRDVVREGDVIQARVLNVDAPNHRMGLSLRHGQATAESPGSR
jgi:small subunit ribosomal protein S1